MISSTFGTSIISTEIEKVAHNLVDKLMDEVFKKIDENNDLLDTVNKSISDKVLSATKDDDIKTYIHTEADTFVNKSIVLRKRLISATLDIINFVTKPLHTILHLLGAKKLDGVIQNMTDIVQRLNTNLTIVHTAVNNEYLKILYELADKVSDVTHPLNKTEQISVQSIRICC